MKRRKGFTLAEMLIVVAIIAILVGIVTPVLTKNLEKAREATDAANIRTALERIQAAAIDGTYDFEVNSKDVQSKAKNVIDKVGRVYIQNTGYIYYTAVELKQTNKKWESLADSNGLKLYDKYLSLTSEPKNRIFYFGVDENGSVNKASTCGVWGLVAK